MIVISSDLSLFNDQHVRFSVTVNFKVDFDVFNSFNSSIVSKAAIPRKATKNNQFSKNCESDMHLLELKCYLTITSTVPLIKLSSKEKQTDFGKEWMKRKYFHKEFTECRLWYIWRYMYCVTFTTSEQWKVVHFCTCKTTANYFMYSVSLFTWWFKDDQVYYSILSKCVKQITIKC